MSFAQAIRTCLRKYATFSGRASRSEYWFFVLFLLLGSFVAGAIDRLVFGTEFVTTVPGEVSYQSTGPTSALFGLATLLPVLAAGWRRMHDSGRSGLYLIYPLLVIVGILLFMGVVAGFGPLLEGDFGSILRGGSLLVFGFAFLVLFISPLLVLWWLLRPGTPGPNSYGPHPSEVTP